LFIEPLMAIRTSLHGSGALRRLRRVGGADQFWFSTMNLCYKELMLNNCFRDCMASNLPKTFYEIRFSMT